MQCFIRKRSTVLSQVARQAAFAGMFGETGILGFKHDEKACDIQPDGAS